MAKGVPYWHRTVPELRKECGKRRIGTKGNKPDLVARLIEYDEGNARKDPEETLPTAEDTIVTTQGGSAFVICGGCNNWERRCICANGQDPEEPRKNRATNPDETSSAPVGAKPNKRNGRYIHRGTFA